ncbi:hypothetical protein DP113_26060 [Brasilonema octagenarum UFV-E1]|uniref:Uncharacterized protein n=1 Tax=Brasilonema sennae CENA114 TaxID=415709 RepID=A0A856MN41_9CYAN|nr:hypothetical protein [Brasilonema sennae]QDL10921.1 hypothetical protein DP114_26135 [Brasilonema sennae CENA114]QDL17267.1 hypothetical protein DP113_26060 [Brasilonema octagenarum UFV-E1]
MTNPIVAVTAAEILKLAFNEFIKSSTGEAAKKLTSEALSKANELRQKIVSRFKDRQNVKAEKAITAVQEQYSLEALNKLTTYLDDEIDEEPSFADDLRQLAQQIINIQNISQKQVQFGEMKQLNRDNAKGTQVQANRIDRIGDDYTK